MIGTCGTLDKSPAAAGLFYAEPFFLMWKRLPAAMEHFIISIAARCRSHKDDDGSNICLWLKIT
jgi:hypothetical protein